MPIPQIYYIDTPSFSTATALYIDVLLTVYAPNGFYSDGVVVRKQFNNTLLPAEQCQSCLPECGTSIAGSGGQGFYRMQFSTGSSTGAIVIRFNPYSVPDGIRAFLSNSSINYNKVAAPIFSGSVKAPGLNSPFTIIGNSVQGSCLPPGIVSYNEFEYDISIPGFVATGNTENYEIQPSDIFLTTSDPGYVTMVVPKTNVSNNVLTIDILGPCSTTNWDINIECPIQLTKYLRSTTASSFTEACTLVLNRVYTFVSVATVPSLTEVGISDYVFNDVAGSSPLANGFYKIETTGSQNIIQVVNGNVVNLYTCI